MKRGRAAPSCRGWVAMVAPDLGVLWIVSSATGIRRMLELEE
ncbi:hypothetical protein [Arthrobacter mobilis]|nr:hypothetical protein [Arthrobacter mobilis]